MALVKGNTPLAREDIHTDLCIALFFIVTALRSHSITSGTSIDFIHITIAVSALEVVFR